MAMVRSTPCQNVIPPSPERRPEPAGVGAVERPPDEIREGGRDRPDGEPPHVAAHDRDRPREREPGGQGAEGEHPGPARLEAEELVRQCARRQRHDVQLEHRPTEVLGDVQAGGRVRPAVPERVAHEHHPGNPPLEADQPGKAEEGRPQHGADDRREERALQPQPGQERPREEDEQADAEVPPEQPDVEQRERAQPVGDGRDPPRAVGRFHLPPFAGITRIRFGGSGLVSPLSAARKRLPGLYAAILPTIRPMPSTARSSASSSKRYGTAFEISCAGPSRESEPAAAFSA